MLYEVITLNKHYEKFHLKDVSFELEQGYIMGFIGSNGAGKTTTLKAILNMIVITSYSIHYTKLYDHPGSGSGVFQWTLDWNQFP